MTFANLLESMLKVKYRLPPAVVEKFNARIKSWEQKIHEALSSAGVSKEIASEIPVEPAGHAIKPHLPGREYWFSILWFSLVDRTKQQPF